MRTLQNIIAFEVNHKYTVDEVTGALLAVLFVVVFGLLRQGNNLLGLSDEGGMKNVS